MHLLEVLNLSHDYTVAGACAFHAINNISFSLDRGEILGIIGHTGSGKSTLVSHLNGLLKPTDGIIKLDGVDIWENPKQISKIRSRVGLVFQYPEYQLFEETVYSDISFGPKNIGLTPDEVNRRVAESAALMSVGAELFERSPFDLSGGQKRRVAIAGIMAMEPELIVFDEPTAGLDPIGRNTIFNAIKKYRDEHNAAVIIVSHSMEDMAAVCDKIMVLNQGSVFDFGTAKEVFSNREKLRSVGLNVPAITNVIYALNERYGYDFEPSITVNEACELILAAIGKRGGNDG